ncbi:hypothetical protein K788_00001960 [Paraburkholderia caribensis MBA4]|uniref:Uncharacterized protein n=1 Tax=Paraburkholderia caribensis MBA4 TaxID=1323664 RepID=A0A0P0RJ80_9BURK|nr:hypothetical protein K788_00001960 [Paraburkholderia caribensis MBA4]
MLPTRHEGFDIRVKRFRPRPPTGGVNIKRFQENVKSPDLQAALSGTVDRF